MMTLDTQMDLAKQARVYLQTKAGESDALPLRFAFSSAALKIQTAIACASAARNEVVARGTLAGGIGQAAINLGEFQRHHPEHSEAIGSTPGMLAEIAGDVKA